MSVLMRPQIGGCSPLCLTMAACSKQGPQSHRRLPAENKMINDTDKQSLTPSLADLGPVSPLFSTRFLWSRLYRQTDRQADRRTDARTDGLTDSRTDRQNVCRGRSPTGLETKDTPHPAGKEKRKGGCHLLDCRKLKVADGRSVFALTQISR